VGVSESEEREVVAALLSALPRDQQQTYALVAEQATATGTSPPIMLPDGKGGVAIMVPSPDGSGGFVPLGSPAASASAAAVASGGGMMGGGGCGGVGVGNGVPMGTLLIPPPKNGKMSKGDAAVVMQVN